MSRTAACAAACAALLLAASAHAAEPAGHPLNLALYAPTAPLSSAEARFAYVAKLAQQLTASGLPAQGRAFARAADLESAIRRGQVDLAILDAVYLAERSLNYPVLATATVGTETALRWGLYAAGTSTGNLLALAGTKLAWAQVGSREPIFLDHVLLDGELRTAQFFELRPGAPDVNAAVSEVVLRRADCVFAPEPVVAGKGLRRVFDAGRVPNPALVLVATKLPRDVVLQAQRAILGAATMGGLDGWKAATGDTYRGLRQRMLSRGTARRLVMSEPQPLLSILRSEILHKEDPTPVLPPLRSLYVIPPGVP